ncbi:STAS domain-containing protein [Vibrio atypicus]|uniref:STAS domain-containing protein n=1 Tax=Vibrio atypicus TaxID=558271 RepID=UPI00135AB6AD|nr:lipid asymmetry maintenance protein MlaB [Vibrio atypicus]
MSQPEWQVVTPSQYALSGVLDRDTVPLLWSQLQQWQVDESHIEVSLEQLERVDSAGMVMLIHLLEHAKKQNCHIILSFVPKQLMTLLQLSNVEQYLDGHLKELKQG